MRFSKLKFLAENSDLNFLTLAEQIYKDYLDTIKLVIVPTVGKTHKLKLREIRVLMSLGSSTSAVSASELAEQLRHDPSTVTRSLVILVRGNYIDTTENEADGRSKMISLTEKGKDVASECRKSLEAFLSNIDAADGLEDSLRSDEVYIQRLTDISRRAAFVLERAKHKG